MWLCPRYNFSAQSPNDSQDTRKYNGLYMQCPLLYTECNKTYKVCSERVRCPRYESWGKSLQQELKCTLVFMWSALNAQALLNGESHICRNTSGSVITLSLTCPPTRRATCHSSVSCCCITEKCKVKGSTTHYMFVVKNRTGQKSFEKVSWKLQLKQYVSSFKTSDISSTALILKNSFHFRYTTELNAIYPYRKNIR